MYYNKAHDSRPVLPDIWLKISTFHHYFISSFQKNHKNMYITNLYWKYYSPSFRSQIQYLSQLPQFHIQNWKTEYFQQTQAEQLEGKFHIASLYECICSQKKITALLVCQACYFIMVQIDCDSAKDETYYGND